MVVARNPKPANQFHVEDPQVFIGDYLAQVEVAPENLFLSNRNLGANLFASTPIEYRTAEFEARNSITVGNGIYAKNNNLYYLTPDGDFIVNNNSKAIMHAGYEIEFLPGTEVEYGSELSAEIIPYECSNVLVKNYTVEDNISEKEYEPYYEAPKSEAKSNQIKESPSILIYPNPNNGKLSVTTNIGCNKMVIKIEELTGKQVICATYINSSYNDIDLINLENGIYLLKVNCENISEIFKIIVAK
ncbi:MAG: T9SS type A sorting domain-containing protein [Bacteroidia bacterium]|nr:T9SS type A sorting domain-containing protein [Bacteroidia bacterium]